jgi:hypothetical protein
MFRAPLFGHVALARADRGKRHQNVFSLQAVVFGIRQHRWLALNGEQRQVGVETWLDAPFARQAQAVGGVAVTQSITCGSDMPMARNFDITLASEPPGR